MSANHLPSETTFDAVVVGAGPAGLTAALVLARSCPRVALIAAPHRPAGDKPDTRTAALFAGSITLLRNLGVWSHLAERCAPLDGIRLIDDTGGLLRAPEVLFRASEVGLEVFGYNVPQEPLVDALRRAAVQAPALTVIESAGLRHLEAGDPAARLTLAEGATLQSRLVAAADGRNSLCRDAAGISVTVREYDQAAVTCVFDHAREHHGISTELHRRAGPLTVVPMPGRASSLVWVERPAVAARLAALEPDAFRRTLEVNLQGVLGRVGALGPRAVFPLRHLSASSYGQSRVALIGEAGHVIPPIGAQGLNLSFRDAASLGEIAGRALAEGRDPGGAEALAAYSSARRTDISTRGLAIDTLNRSLLSDLVPVQLARGAALQVISSIGPLRRAVITAGLQPFGELPRLMRETAAPT